MDASFFSVIGLFNFVLARGHFSRPHSYPLSATNRIRSAIIERNRTRRKPSVLKVSLFSPLLIVSPSLSVKTNDNLGLDWIPLNFSLSPNLYFPYSSGKTISPSLYPRGPVKKELYKGDQNILYQRRVFVTVNSVPIFLMPGWVTFCSNFHSWGFYYHFQGTECYLTKSIFD